MNTICVKTRILGAKYDLLFYQHILSGYTSEFNLYSMGKRSNGHAQVVICK